jgi:C1A family cysteine protease
MKATILIVLALVALTMADPMWQRYKNKFNKHYETPEEDARRMAIFKKNMGRIMRLNQLDTARHSWTAHSDKEQSELSTKLAIPEKIERTVMEVRDDLPTSFDWRDQQGVNPIKDQADCGSCWAFSATASIESANFIKNGKLISLAEQQLVDCDKEDSGCDGGWPQNGMDYVSEVGGQELEKTYKYTAADGKCAAEKSLFVGTVSKSYAFENNEEAMMEAVMKHGVVAVAIDAGKFNSYYSGIMNGKGCMKGSPDHGVAIVGWGVEKGTKYWIVRNSWGSSWGEDGYVRMERGVNACGIEDFPMGCDA